jgi:hypothetical protein
MVTQGGWGSRTWTYNFLINSQAFCQLNYTPILSQQEGSIASMMTTPMAIANDRILQVISDFLERNVIDVGGCRRSRRATIALWVFSILSSSAEESNSIRYHFGRVSVVPFFILPLACLDSAFDEKLLSPSAEASDVLSSLAKANNWMPFSVIVPFSALIFAALVCGYAEIGNRRSRRRLSPFWILTQISD